MYAGSTIEDKELQSFSSQFTLPEKKKIPSKEKKPRVIVLSGPTAVGKTKLSLLIAHALGGEIISADSMQVYRGMDIGTAKLLAVDRESVPHYLIDIKDISETFNVVDFYFEAHKVIQQVLALGAVPIVVGGTGFYLRALIYGPPNGPPSISDVRARFELEMQEKGSEALYEKLKKIDPDYALTITANDKQKIVRALEIITVTDRKVSHFSKQTSEEMQSYDFRCWFLYKSKDHLYPIIEKRCEHMIASGLLEEVKELEKRGLSKNTTASQAIGYRQCLDFLTSSQSEGEWQKFLTAFKQASRRYAKRQFTWFRKEPLFRWLDMEANSFEKASEMISQDYETGF
ncbi:MAG: tRNA (adenosine(37)-N6)-dimethylallyltransferase MiaA [Chlamydiae bacterium]|nr:tRNA (adenosine(37)-N6)-dimethylallyltransferase MiaA [Chlamydiota bacterium]